MLLWQLGRVLDTVVKIRHFGLLANRNRRQALALCRFHPNATAADSTESLTEQQRSALNRSCPRCKRGTMHVIAHHFAAELATLNPSLHCATFDSS
jgi:hypothetical protein